jgi:hypothetical protein
MKLFQTSIILCACLNSFGQITINNPQTQTINFPSINEVSVTEIGNTIVSASEEEVFKNGFHLNSPKEWTGLHASYSMQPSDFYFHSSNIKGKLYVSVEKCVLFFPDALRNSKNSENFGSIFIFNDGDKVKYNVFNDVVGGTLALNYGYGHKTSNTIKKDIAETKTIRLISDKTFKQEFIYGGKVGTSAKFTYREYIDDLARPSFSQEVQYDLNDGSIIGFKGLKIEILEINNLEVKYKVLSHFMK